MNLYADLRIADDWSIEQARKQLAAYWPKVNPGKAHVETMSEEVRPLDWAGREEKVLVIKWAVDSDPDRIAQAG